MQIPEKRHGFLGMLRPWSAIGAEGSALVPVQAGDSEVSAVRKCHKMGEVAAARRVYDAPDIAGEMELTPIFCREKVATPRLYFAGA